MNMRLELRKAETVLVNEAFAISDADSFAKACSELWTRVEQRCLDRTTNVGELMDIAGENVARELDGAELRISKA